jgi:ferredoxin-NADP reductase
MTLEVSGPLNHFELEPASEYHFVAGGIGITPIKAMIESLPAHRNWRLDYVGRSRRSMVFAEALAARYPGRVHLYMSEELGPKIDLDAILPTWSPALVYCCGPESLMDAVESRVPTERMHLERFIPVDRTVGLEPQAVIVTARRSGRTFDVAANESLLDVMDKNGLPIVGSCRKGVCGTCEVRVLGGTPEHLDSVMSDAEKDALGIMYPCVSRAKTPTLVLDV